MVYEGTVNYQSPKKQLSKLPANEAKKILEKLNKSISNLDEIDIKN